MMLSSTPTRSLCRTPESISTSSWHGAFGGWHQSSDSSTDWLLTSRIFGAEEPRWYENSQEYFEIAKKTLIPISCFTRFIQIGSFRIWMYRKCQLHQGTLLKISGPNEYWAKKNGSLRSPRKPVTSCNRVWLILCHKTSDSLRKLGRQSDFKKLGILPRLLDNIGYKQYRIRLSITLVRNRIYGCVPSTYLLSIVT